MQTFMVTYRLIEEFGLALVILILRDPVMGGVKGTSAELLEMKRLLTGQKDRSGDSLRRIQELLF